MTNATTEVVKIFEDADKEGGEAVMPLVGVMTRQDFGVVEYEHFGRVVVCGLVEGGQDVYFLEHADGISGPMRLHEHETCGELVARWLADRGFASEIIRAEA